MLKRRVQSTAEAMVLHEKYNTYRLRAGRVVAVKLALQHGEVHAGMVGTELVRVGALPVTPPNEATERWHGGLFADRKTWEPVGRKVPRDDVGRNTHKGGEGRNLWRLVAGADLSEYAELPPMPPELFTSPTYAPSTNAQDTAAAERNMLLDFVAAVREYERAKINSMNVANAWDVVDDALRRMGHEKPVLVDPWPDVS